MIVYAELELYTLRTNNINNPPLLPLHDSEDYAACCFVVEDENFPGYVKLSNIFKSSFLRCTSCMRISRSRLENPMAFIIFTRRIERSSILIYIYCEITLVHCA
jgi:hypothetical protein